jgi:chromosome segregation ATPase
MDIRTSITNTRKDLTQLDGTINGRIAKTQKDLTELDASINQRIAKRRKRLKRGIIIRERELKKHYDERLNVIQQCMEKLNAENAALRTMVEQLQAKKNSTDAALKDVEEILKHLIHRG